MSLPVFTPFDLLAPPSFPFVSGLAGPEIVSRILATVAWATAVPPSQSVDHMAAAPADNLLFRSGCHWLHWDGQFVELPVGSHPCRRYDLIRRLLVNAA